ncbi:Pre-rRNA-processing protein TSR2 homolog [Eumeta japonica]|uniref:Pre-rRNA-processing protein TSR2 homolog n=1 Tax=Eumeta variegata TaxID=151549 RepID=A0A4C1XUM6_EUMVA|nr:Pre-rRNA-processing protein TSR2 homolog [Eumeta japonica]
MLLDDFKPIVDLVLNNWTALQLAVEHGMGAPGGKQTAQLMSVYVAQYCVDNEVECDDLVELLEDLMDEEFETVCHDNSPREVAQLLLMFLGLLKEGHHDELRNRIEAMPKCQLWLSQPTHPNKPPQVHGHPDDDTTSSESDEDDESEQNRPSSAPVQHSSAGEPMDEDPDPGWTVVRPRRKK